MSNPGTRKPVGERFHAKVMPEPDDPRACQLWLGALNQDGYGIFWVGPGNVFKRAHVWHYESVHGALKEGQELDHVFARGCTNRACVRLSHLEPVSHTENLVRTRWRREHFCKNLHPRSEENTRWYNGHRICRVCEKASRQRAKERRQRERQQAA